MNNGGYKSDLNINEKVLMAIVRISEQFKKDSSAIFADYGLTFAQYNVLRVLDASENGENTITNVSKIMLVSGANMTGIAKRMEKNGFLIRKGHSKDERITLLEITPKGKQTLRNILKEKEKNISVYFSKFSDNEKLQILEKLKQMFNRTS